MGVARCATVNHWGGVAVSSEVRGHILDEKSLIEVGGVVGVTIYGIGFQKGVLRLMELK